MFRTGCGKGELLLLRGDGDSVNQGKEGLGSENDENARKRFKEDYSGFGSSNELRLAGDGLERERKEFNFKFMYWEEFEMIFK